MALRATIGIEVDGARDAARELAAVNRQIKETAGADAERRAIRFRRDLANLSRQERRETFSRLSTEQQLSRLTERRLFIERQIVRAQQAGNAYRVGALRLSLANVSGQIAGIGPTGLSRFLGQAGGQIAGFFGGLGMGAVGGLGLAGLGASIGMLVRNIERSVEESGIFADNLEDMADMLGLKPSELSALKRSALAAGVTSRAVYSVVGRLRSEMASALGGDTTALGRFTNYGVTREMLRSGDVIGIGQQIRNRLGSRAGRPEYENDLRAFFGQRPGVSLKIFGDLRKSGLTDESIRKMATIGASFEEVDANFEERAVKLDAQGKWFQAWLARMERGLPFTRSTYAAAIRSARARSAKRMGVSVPPDEAPAEVLPFNSENVVKPSEPSPFAGRPTIDALMRIGLFRGGAEARQLGLLRDQVNRLNEVVAQLKALNREVAAE